MHTRFAKPWLGRLLSLDVASYTVLQFAGSEAGWTPAVGFSRMQNEDIQELVDMVREPTNA